MDVGMRIDIASIDMVSEVNMVSWSFFFPSDVAELSACLFRHEHVERDVSLVQRLLLLLLLSFQHHGQIRNVSNPIRARQVLSRRVTTGGMASQKGHN